MVKEVESANVEGKKLVGIYDAVEKSSLIYPEAPWARCDFKVLSSRSRNRTSCLFTGRTGVGQPTVMNAHRRSPTFRTGTATSAMELVERSKDVELTRRPTIFGEIVAAI